MPRISKKNLALQAAYEIVEHSGVEAITYDSLAEATGLSKSGLIYHFPSRHELLVELHRYTAANWEKELESLAGDRTASELSPQERQRAMALSLGKNDPLAELLLNIHAQSHQDFSGVWQEVNDRWSPNPAQPVSDDAELNQLISGLLGLGLWVHDHVSETQLSDDNRQRILDHVLTMIDVPSK